MPGASSTATVRSVGFFDGSKRIATKTKGNLDLFAADWPAKSRAKGKHTLRAVVTDAKGRTTSASLAVHTCK